MEEDYVSFKTANLLKEKGFPINEFLQNKIGYFKGIPVSKITEEMIEEQMLSCIPQSVVMKWLREVPNICIIIFPETTDDDGEAGCLWGYAIIKRLMVIQESNSTYMSYNDACESAINDCLTILN